MIDEQLTQWLEGKSIHSEQCCPDFSCCKPENLAPRSVRERFIRAVKANDEKAKMEMLGMFIGQAFSGKVYVAGLEVPESEL